MDAPPADHAPVTRRRLFRLAGGAALTLAGACAQQATTRSTPPQSKSEPNPAQPQDLTATPPAAPVPAPEPVGPAGIELCRDAWGAQPPRAGGIRHTITRMTLHHSAVPFGDADSITERLRQHQRFHQDQRGWIDIAYHVGIDPEGNVFELRTPEIAGDTATDYDTTGHFLVLCEGDFDQQPVPQAQLNSAALVFAWAAQNFRLATDTLAGHRDVAPTTSCPGANLYAYVASGELKERIDHLFTAGPVDLRRVCGPEAARMVAAIEAGN